MPNSAGTTCIAGNAEKSKCPLLCQRGSPSGVSKPGAHACTARNPAELPPLAGATPKGQMPPLPAAECPQLSGRAGLCPEPPAPMSWILLLLPAGPWMLALKPGGPHHTTPQRKQRKCPGLCPWGPTPAGEGGGLSWPVGIPLCPECSPWGGQPTAPGWCPLPLGQ